jgi:two-component system, sensor histidine kinase and response regulator
MTDEENRYNNPTRTDVEPGVGEGQDMTSSVVFEGGLDLASVLDRVGGDADLLREIASIFLEEYPALMQEIRTAVHTNDPVRLERAAHSLKGSVANFGARDATAAALTMESIGRQNRMTDAPEGLVRLEREFTLIEPVLQQVVRGEF